MHLTMIPRFGALLGFSLLLASCGGGDAAPEATAEAENAGNVASAVAGAATGLIDTSDLPAFVEIYEGGTPIMNMKSNDGGNAGGLLSYTVKAPIADVVAFHRASAKRAGIEFKTEAAAQEGMTLAGTSADESKSLMVIIVAGDGETTVSLTHGTKSG
jgi:hypothetical protein